ncbi:hypothetical protein C8R46DRAFT_47013 [Mycena filopes]|nr:hypothetical protein C8R46DRAFT_47013 [Mycena filopes]
MLRWMSLKLMGFFLPQPIDGCVVNAQQRSKTSSDNLEGQSPPSGIQRYLLLCDSISDMELGKLADATLAYVPEFTSSNSLPLSQLSYGADGVTLNHG